MLVCDGCDLNRPFPHSNYNKVGHFKPKDAGSFCAFFSGARLRQRHASSRPASEVALSNVKNCNFPLQQVSKIMLKSVCIHIFHI